MIELISTIFIMICIAVVSFTAGYGLKEELDKINKLN